MEFFFLRARINWIQATKLLKRSVNACCKTQTCLPVMFICLLFHLEMFVFVGAKVKVHT
jgi:hypothetical protein